VIVRGGDVATCLATLEESSVVEAPFGGCAIAAGLLRPPFGGGKVSAMPARRRVDAAQLAFSGDDSVVESAMCGGELRVAGLCSGKVGADLST
jgi:hypothetical protein